MFQIELTDRKAFLWLFWFKVASCLCKECRQTGGTKSRLSPCFIQCSSIQSRYTSSEKIDLGELDFVNFGSQEMIVLQNHMIINF